MQRCPRCNGTGHGARITNWCDTCELCLGRGVVYASATSAGFCTTPLCTNVTNPWSVGGMCDGCVREATAV